MVILVYQQLVKEVQDCKYFYSPFTFITPPKKSVPKGRRPEGATALRSNASPFRAGVPSGRIFWGGFERKLPKKIHNGSENSENQKK